ncbi:MAG: hypothetical protein KKF12_13300 [Proteobacteria bacterium]|nr:hypothetical protein [Desulfobacula sp.]MBU3952393.1 hypothetical protein [Pseudomonadota bacterium]MBU4131791.1 hypothetical protein [Pseudomonadota bacterium]
MEQDGDEIKSVMEDAKTDSQKYTCNEYREEMILLGLQRQLASPDLVPEKKQEILKEIARVEALMGLD